MVINTPVWTTKNAGAERNQIKLNKILLGLRRQLDGQQDLSDKNEVCQSTVGTAYYL